MKVIIVGGVAAGAAAAARLRRLCEQADILLLEKSGDISIASCGLPYYVGGEIETEDKLRVQTPEAFAKRFSLDLRVRHEATGIDRAAKTLFVRDLATGRSYTERYDKLLLCPGAAPVVPDLPGADPERVFTLRTIPDAVRIRAFVEERRLATAVVVGGGAIGVEMAENLARQGCSVTIVEAADQLLPSFDPEMAAGVQAHLEDQGVRLLLGRTVAGFAPAGEGLVVNTGDEQLHAGLVVLCVGVRPDTALAARAGLCMGARGAIRVDAQLRTSDPDIYAAGDAVEAADYVTGRPVHLALAGPAGKQGHIAADNICGRFARYRGSQASAVVKAFGRTAACTGLSEKTAKAAGISCDKVYIHAPSHADYYPGAQPLVLKLLFAKGSGRVLGGQLVGGDGVDKRCDVLATAIRANMDVFELAELELCYAPPYSSAKDPVNVAGAAAGNVVAGLVKQVYWEDYKNLPKDGSVTILDVRSAGEHRRGHLDGVTHIPLDELRGRLGELDKAKPVYVHCQSGLRSYLACRILAQNGFDCYNYAGGYRLFEEMEQGSEERGHRNWKG